MTFFATQNEYFKNCLGFICLCGLLIRNLGQTLRTDLQKLPLQTYEKQDKINQTPSLSKKTVTES